MGVTKKLLFNFLILLLTVLFLCTVSCNTTEPPDKTSLQLTLEDVSCTEAWITLTTNNLQLPAEINLIRTDAHSNSKDVIFYVSTADTLLYLDSLLPNQTYKFQTSGIGNPASGIRSNELSITTLDTTSHNFTFETWTFGDIGSSTLYDVAIISENNIWCVGDIKIADTSENGYTTYNAVHWDGSQWTLHRIMFYTFCGQQHQNAYPASAVFTIDDETIIVGSNSQVAYLKNGVQTKIDCIPASVNKIWGSSSNDLYVVGNNGSIAHYNGSQWSSIESGTNLNINDIWGDYNEKTGEWEILAVSSNFGTSLEKVILQIKNNSTITLPLSPQMWPLKTVWFLPNKQYYVAGAGVYQKRFLTDKLWKNEATDITTFSTYSIRGNNINDVVGVGAFGDLIHFNGLIWKNDYNAPNLNNGSYKSVEINGNIIFAVGNEYYRAVILKGKR